MSKACQASKIILLLNSFLTPQDIKIKYVDLLTVNHKPRGMIV